MSEHNVERIKSATRLHYSFQELERKLLRSEELRQQLSEENRILEHEVKLSEEKVTNANKRIAEYANKAYMKRLGEPDSPVLSGELIDVTT